MKEIVLSLVLFQETTGATPPATAGSGIATIAVIGTLILIAVVVIALIVIAWKSSQGPAGAAGGRSWLDYGNFFIVALGIVAVLVAFLIAMLFTTELFRDATQVLAILTALFGVIGTLVGTYFGVKAGSDAAEGARNLASGAIATTQPTVLSVEPPPGASGVDPNTEVTATFSTDMNPDTLTKLTFTLSERDTGNPVPDTEVTYEPLTKRATLSLGAALIANTAYRATITTDVRNQAGNALPAAFTWDFTVAP